MTTHHLVGLLRRGAVVAVLAVASNVWLGAGPAAASVPSDPSAKGFIGLCDSRNHNVSSGDVNASPFVWKAVASEPPPKDYLGRGENAVLNIYQPRPGVDAADWNGDQLTASTFYSTVDAPTAQATLKDISLGVVVNEFPPLVDGLYQLRMYFGKTNVGIYSATYPATMIRVEGKRWTVVDGGTVNCAAATGDSSEVLTGAVSRKQAYGDAAPRPAQGRASSSPTEAAGVADSPGASSSASAGAAAAGQTNQPATASTGSASGGSSTTWWAVAVVAVLAAAFALGRLRRKAPTQT